MITQRLCVLVVAVVALGWTLPTLADRPESTEAKDKLRVIPPKLKLDHVIHGIDAIYLVDFAFYFDGGSLSFHFADSPRGDRFDEVVYICLPIPQSAMTQPTPPGQLVRQTVLASPHSKMSRFAVSSSNDPDYDSFVMLIREATISEATDELQQEKLQDGLAILQAAVVEGIKPKKWGGDAFEKYRKRRKR